MRHEIEAPPRNAPGSPLRFQWNHQTGELAGHDAERIRQAAKEARQRGSIDDQPQSSAATDADPLTTYEGMAALLAFDLLRQPPEWLAEWLPKPTADSAPDETPVVE